MEVIASNYKLLMSRCNIMRQGYFCSKTYEDIFEDTVLYVSTDVKASKLKTDKEIIDWFCYRFRMLEYQTINDNKELREIGYADNIQTDKD